MPKITSACCVWDFTLGESFSTVDDLKKFLRQTCKKWTFQLEKGEKTGFLHYQGRVSLKVKARKGPAHNGIHWSVTHDENKDNLFYVIKTDTRVDGPWSDTDKYIPRQAREIELYTWQKQIVGDLDWDTRTINVLFNPSENIGKSTLTNWAGSRGIARKLPVMDSHKDYMRMVMDCPKVRLYLVDFPRALNKTQCCGFWSAIEEIKNGYAYDDRYGFKEEYFDCPNIWVFTNTLPDTTVLTGDRWKFWQVDYEKKLVQFYPDGP